LSKISADPNLIKRGVAITLAKNPQFHRLPNGDIGLLAWYPNIKKAKESKPADDSEDETAVGSDVARENKENREREEAAQKEAEEAVSSGPPPRPTIKLPERRKPTND